MKKEIGALMLLGAVLLSGCSSDRSGAVTKEAGDNPSNQVTTQLEQESDIKEKLIIASENEKVKMYAVDEKDDKVQGVRVEINGKKKEFDWNFPALEDYKPQLSYTDVTGDGKEEAIITLFKDRSPGVYLEEIHVLESDGLAEINVRDPLKVITESVKTSVQEEEGSLAVTVKIGNQEYELKHAADKGFKYKNELNFGGVVDYVVVDNQIMAKVDGSVGIGEYICTVTISYKYDSANKLFTADKIEFSPIKQRN